MTWEDFINIFNLRDDRFLRAVLFLLVVISPGLTITLTFYNSFIFSLDSIKIILLSIALSSPNLLGSLLLLAFFNRKLSEKLDVVSWFLLSLVTFYGHLFWFFFGIFLKVIPFTFDFYSYWLTYILLLILFIIISFVFPAKRKKR